MVERFYTPDETVMRMYKSPDRTGFVLNQPMAGAPGVKFNYNGGNPYLLSALINRKSGQSAFDFAKKELFEPLGIKSAKWGAVDAQGVTIGEAGLFLAPHDMAELAISTFATACGKGSRSFPRRGSTGRKRAGLPRPMAFSMQIYGGRFPARALTWRAAVIPN